MALQASGNEIKYSQIIAEFGTPTNGGLGEYRLSGGENVGSLTDIPLDVGVPTSGEIKFSDFYGKRLNQIVDLYSSSVDETFRQDAKDRWEDGEVHVVGSTKTSKTKPPDTTDDRVIIHINQQIGSSKSQQKRCAVRTGKWDSGTILEIEVGPNGAIYGAGGNGGKGGKAKNGDGGNGKTGTSALGIEYACTINNLGVIQAGYGGGGGGGGRKQTTNGGKKKPTKKHGSPGGGGGGGAGFPAGNAGLCPDDAFGKGTNGDDGAAGTLSGKASGGTGGNYGGDGGSSSPVNNFSIKADDGDDAGGKKSGDGGTGGGNGFAIITNQSSAPSISGGGSVTGIVTTSLNPT